MSYMAVEVFRTVKETEKCFVVQLTENCERNTNFPKSLTEQIDQYNYEVGGFLKSAVRKYLASVE